MLDHMRRRAATELARAESVSMASKGPAGLQMGLFPCCAVDLSIYLLIPGTSEQLVNLEEDAEVVLACEAWQAQGDARQCKARECPEPVKASLLQLPDARWSQLVVIEPRRLQLFSEHGSGFSETIDLK